MKKISALSSPSSASARRPRLAASASAPSLLAACLLLAPMAAPGQAVVTKDATGTDLTAGSSWIGGAPPTAANVAAWTTTSLGPGLTVGTNVAWGSIDITGATADIGITGAGSITTGNISLAGNRALTIANALVLSGNSVYTIGDVNGGPAADATLSGGISGAFSLQKAGAGTLFLLGGNSFNGGTTVNAGTIVVDGNQSGNRLANGSALTINNGGTFEIRGVNALPTAGNANNVTVNAGGVLRVVSGASAAANDSHNHLGNLALNGGTVDLTYAGTGNAYNGESFRLNGNVTVGGAAPSLIQSSATAATQGMALAGARTFTVADVTGSAAADLTISAELENTDTNDGALIKAGAGTLVLTSASSYTNGTTINAGAISTGLAGALGTGPVTLDGGTLAVTATGQNFTQNFALGAAGGTVDSSSIVAVNASASLSGVISGAGPLTLRATGNLTNTGGGDAGLGIRLANAANTFTGDVTVTAGLVSYASDGSFGAAANNIILNGGGLLDSNLNIPLARNIQVQAGGGTFRLYGSTNATWSGAVTGAGNINRTDGGTLTLSGSLAGYSGTYNNQGGNTTLTGTAPTIGGNWVLSTGTLTVNSSANQTLAGTISGGGALAKAGAGTLTLSAANSHTGGTTITGGAISTGLASGLGTGTVTLNGGTLAVTTAGQTFGQNFALGAAGGTVDSSSNGGNNVTTSLSGVISGTGPLTLRATGNVSPSGGSDPGLGIRLASGANTFTGDVTVTSGLVSYAGNGSFGAAANRIILNGGGLLDNTGGTPLARDIQVLAGGGTFRLYGSTNATWSGAVTGAGNINRTDGGTLTLSGSLAGYTGTYNNQGGNTTLTGTAPTIGGNWALTAGTLTVNSSANQTLAGTISGTSPVVKAGAGALTLTAANTYTGATNVTGGALLVSGAGSIASSSGVTVQSGALLGGNGTVSAVNVLSGGTLSPGNSPGQITVTNGLTLNPGAALFAEVAIGGVGGTGNGTTGTDLIALTGGVTLANATLSGTWGGTEANIYRNGNYSANTMFFLLNNDGADAINGTFANSVPSAGLSAIFGGGVNAHATTVGGQSFALFYNANINGGFSLTNLSGGNDLLLIAVPEPGRAALLGLSAALLLLRRRRRRQG